MGNQLILSQQFHPLILFSNMDTSFSMIGSEQPSQQPSFSLPGQLTLPLLLQHLRSMSQFPLHSIRQKQYQSHCLEYSEHPSNVLKWLDLFLPQYTSLKNTASFLHNINSNLVKLPQSQYSQKIKQDILRNNNFLGNFIRDTLLVYLFKKYEVHNYTDNENFLKEFERDVKWIKEYLSTVIVKVYGGWINDIEDAEEYFYDKGVFEIMTEMDEWEIIYAIFNKCLPKHKNKLSETDVEYYYNSVMSSRESKKNENGQEINMGIPFESTIQFLREFYETKQISKKMNQLKQLDKLLVSQIKSLQLSHKKQVDQYTKLRHLEYCIYVSGKQIIKSVLYIETIMDKEVIDVKSRFRQSKFILRSIYDASYTLLCDYYESYKKLNISQKFISFRIPKPRSLETIPFKLSSIKIIDVFSTETSHLVLFSVSSLIVGSFVKIQIISKENNLAIGVCNRKGFEGERNKLTHSKHSLVFNVMNKRVYENGGFEQQGMEGHIHRIGLVVNSQKQVEWVINDSRHVVRRKYEHLVQEERKELYACISFKQGTEFKLVEF